MDRHASSSQDFESLFVPVDTIRLDPDPIVLPITALSVSNSGDLLISDPGMKTVYNFSASGALIGQLDAIECDPGVNFEPVKSIFLPNGDMLSSTAYETFHFNASGQCIGRIEELTPPPRDYCVSSDTLYSYSVLSVERSPVIQRYSIDFVYIDEFQLPPPEFPRMNLVSRGLPGMQLACFNDDVYYYYTGSSVTYSLRDKTRSKNQVPYGYRKPARDYRALSSMSDKIMDIQKVNANATQAIGLLPLGMNRRILLLMNPLSEGVNDYETSWGLDVSSLAENENAGFTTPVLMPPYASLENRIYIPVKSDLTNREPTNPSIIVYEFVDK